MAFASGILNAILAGVEATTLADHHGTTAYARVADQRALAAKPAPRSYILAGATSLRDTERNSISTPELELGFQAAVAYPDTGDSILSYGVAMDDVRALMRDIAIPGSQGAGRAALEAALGASAPDLSLVRVSMSGFGFVGIEGMPGYFEATLDFRILFQAG